MMETFTRTDVNNQRADGKSTEKNMRGITTRLAKARETNSKLNIEDIGTDAFKLREGDDRDAIIIGIRDETAKMVKSIQSLKRELSPEDTENTLNTLKGRVAKNKYVDVEWQKVEEVLRDNPEALWSVNQMQKKGHNPNVYYSDDEGFDIGTCSKERPESGKNCVYDAQAALLVEKNPDATFNGSAVEQAKAMGIKLMSYKKYKDSLQKKDRVDTKTRSWLLTDKNTREAGEALTGNRNGDDVYVNRYHANFHYYSRGWRGSLRVLWA